jgi:cobalt/nickel transport system permease protein
MGPLSKLDARLKLVATMAFVVAVVATPIGWWRLLAAEGLILAFVVGLSGLSPTRLFVRWLGFLVLVGFLAGVVAVSHPSRAQFGVGVVALTILAKNSIVFVAMLVLVGVTPFRQILTALTRLGMPPILVATLQLMDRYLYVFGEELGRMSQARRSRTFRRTARLDWGVLGGLVGALLLRACERGERVHAAMVARGWDGQVRMLDR